MATNVMITCPLNHPRGHIVSIHEISCASIENTCCHQPSSIVTQSIGIYDHFRVLPKGQSLLLISIQAQYSLKVENPCSIVVW